MTQMVVFVFGTRFLVLVLGRQDVLGSEKVSSLINAAAVGGMGNELKNEVVVVES